MRPYGAAISACTLAITGGTGFVGRTLIRVALTAGWKIRALARGPQAAQDGVTWVGGALDQPGSLAELVGGADAVIHVAGVVNAADRAAFEAGNVLGTSAIVDAALAADVKRFIHISSLSARMPALSNYGWSKAESERVVEECGLNWTIVRPPWIYGPDDKDALDLFKMAQRGFVPLPPHGHVSVIEVSDLARLLLALIDAPESYCHTYEPDDDCDDWTHAAFAHAIGAAFGKNVTTFALPKAVMLAAARLDRLFRGKHAKLTVDRVGYMTHPDWRVDPAHRPPAYIWRPQVNTRDGLKATVVAYRAAGWL